MRNRPAIPKIAIGLAAVLGVLAAPAMLHAQETTALGEIIVTARKRAENLQDVGVSVSALSTRRACAPFRHRPPDAGKCRARTSSSTTSSRGPAARPRSRSAASARRTSRRTSTRPSASCVDGVFIGVNSGAMIKALDLAERGDPARTAGHAVRPQLDRAASSTSPAASPATTDSAAAVRAGAGNNGDLQLDGYVNVPLGDKFAFKLGGAYARERRLVPQSHARQGRRRDRIHCGQPELLVQADRRPRDLLPLRQDLAGPGREHGA